MSKSPARHAISCEKSKMSQPNLEIKYGFDRGKTISDAAYFRGENGDHAEGASLSLWLAADDDFNAVFNTP